MPRKLMSDLELGQRERERRRAVIGIRISKDLVAEVERRAERAGLSRGAFVSAIVRDALVDDSHKHRGAKEAGR